MTYHQTSDDARLARDTRVVVDRDPDSGSRTIMYVVVALVALGLIYLAASAFWGSTDTSSVPATTIENTTIVPQTEPDALAPPPADTIAPAPDAMAPATPDAGSNAIDLAPPAVTPAPEPAPAPAPVQ